MRELHGVVPDSEDSIPSLKRDILLFDKFHLSYLQDPMPKDIEVYRAYRNDLDFLRSRDVMLDFDDATMFEAGFQANWALGRDFQETLMSGPPRENPIDAIADFVVKFRELRNSDLKDDYMVRHLSTTLNGSPGFDVVPICKVPLPEILTTPDCRSEQVLTVALEALPFPDATCSWESILDFKASLHDKLWSFRRFLKTLSTTHQTEAEIKDDIEWSVNEYRKAMEIHHIKASESFFEVYVIPAVELVEDLAKFNWSKIGRGALAVTKRKVELLETEMKAPGRECAYVFEARKRFGAH